MPLLEAVGISKRYGGILALNNMHFAANAGEVHAILGENGAGKSTFIQILSGAVAADEGELRLDGAPYRAARPARGAPHRHQPGVPGTVADPRSDRRREHLLRRRAADADRHDLAARPQREGARAVRVARACTRSPPDVPVRTLSIGDRQLIEIVKGLANDPEDPHPRRGDLGAAAARKSTGCSTRRGNAPRQASWCSTSRIAWTRCGASPTASRCCATARRWEPQDTASLSDDDIVAMMLGRRLDRLFPAAHAVPPTGKVALKVDRLKVGHLLRGVSFELARRRGAGRRRPAGARPARTVHGAVRRRTRRRPDRSLGQAGVDPRPAARAVASRSAWRCCPRTAAARASCSASRFARTSC